MFIDLRDDIHFTRGEIRETECGYVKKLPNYQFFSRRLRKEGGGVRGKPIDAKGYACMSVTMPMQNER